MSSGRRGRGAADGGGGTTQRGTRGGITAPRSTTAYRGRGPNSHGSITTSAPRGQSSDRGARSQRSSPSTQALATTRAIPNSSRGGATVTTGSIPLPDPRATSLTGITNTTPFPQDRYDERLDYLRKQRPALKEKLIKEKLMNPDGPIPLQDSVDRVGLCTEMCPEFERVRRIVENDIMGPEYTPESLRLNDRSARVPDEARMVKAYKRSAAGSDEELVIDLRTPIICQKTLQWMIERTDNEPLGFLYGWLWDRTRCLRKDLRQQAIKTRDGRAILLDCHEQCARFHLVALHQMSLSDSEDYSHQQNVEQLNQTCISLKEFYKDNRKAKVASHFEAEFQAYRLIMALYTKDHLVENDIGALPEALRRNRRMQTAIEIHRAGKAVIARSRRLGEAQQNWKAFWDLVASPSVSYLMACAAELVFNDIRHLVLDTIFRAYKSGAARQSIPAENWTTNVLIELLGLDTEDDVREFCGHYGFSFRRSAHGIEFMDIASVPYGGRGLQKPATLPPQLFSYRLVESKRFDRLLSAVIKGKSVMEARASGAIKKAQLTATIEPDNEARMDDDSLFIPEEDTSAPKVTGTHGGFGSAHTPAGNPLFSPFADAGQATGVPSSTFPNQQSGFGAQANTGSPFAKPSSFTPAIGAPSAASNPFSKPATTTPFTTTPAASNPFGKPSSSPFSTSSTAPTTSTGSPFGKPSPFATPSPATGQQVQPGLFDPAKNSVKFSSSLGSSFGTGAGASEPSSFSGTEKAGSSIFTSTTPASSVGGSFFAPNTSSQNVLGQSAPSPFGGAPSDSRGLFTGVPEALAFDKMMKSKDSGTTPSFTPAFSTTGKQPESVLKSSKPAINENTSPFALSANTGNQTQPKKVTFSEKNQEIPAEDEEERRVKEEQECREREEEKRRKEEEVRQRAREEAQRRMQEERERKAREEEQRRREEEERRRQEEERKRQEEQERAARAARAAAAAELARREEEQKREKDQAMEALTKSIFLDPAQGLLAQFLEQQVQELVPVVREEIWLEGARRWAEERYQARQKERVVRVLQRWVEIVRKKKRMGKARDRRRWLKENAGLLAAASAGSTPAPASPNTEQVPLQREKVKSEEKNTFKKPTVPASATRKAPVATNGVERRRKTARPLTATTANGTTQKAAPTNEKHLLSTDEAPMTFYRNPSAPIDRTQTNYFKLRAQGLDPAKILKRSLDSSASYDDNGAGEQRKRARTSMEDGPTARPASRASFSHSSRRPSLVERVDHGESSFMDRFRAVKESLSRSIGGRGREKSGSVSRHMPAPQHHRSPSIYGSVRGARSPPSHTNDVIAKARALLGSTTATSQRGSPAPGLSGLRNSEFSRSVPNLHASHSQYNNSLGASQFGHSRISFVGSPAPERTIVANKPAYWARQSAFVPKHLYGKGPDAMKEYFASSRGGGQGGAGQGVVVRGGMSPATAAKPLDLSSSPIPTQILYIPTQTQGQTQTRMPMREAQSQSQAQANSDMGGAGYGDDNGVVLDEDGDSEMEGYSHTDIGDVESYEENFEAIYESDVEEEIEVEGGSVQHSGDEDGDDEDDEEDEDEDSMDEDDEDEDEEAYNHHTFHNGSNAQQDPGAGATQDDAIELSD